MTPGARVAAAADILDDILAGTPAEKALTGWARRSRFAGSKDRAAVRDLVFDAVRCRRSFGWLGGGESGRALMLGRLRDRGEDPAAVFTGEGHALEALSETEQREAATLEAAPRAVRLDVPDWVLPLAEASLGDEAEAVLGALRQRAPVVLRANRRKTTREDLIAVLQDDGFDVAPHPLAEAAIVMPEGVRGLAQHAAFLDGRFEFQDAASQAAVEEIAEVIAGADVLDYCAGGGGKALAMAALGARVVAHDANAARMRDLPLRASRAGESIGVVDAPKGRFDVVVCDVPCSGSGAWRRQPDAKWRLTESGLAELVRLQQSIVGEALGHVAEGGRLVYMTCSLLAQENEAQVEALTASLPGLRLGSSRRYSPLEGGDGFFCAVFETS